MYICTLILNQFYDEYVSFLDVKENTIMDGSFAKLIYTAPTYTMNSVFLNLPLIIDTFTVSDQAHTQQYNSNTRSYIQTKYALVHLSNTSTENTVCLQHLREMENTVLNNYANYYNTLQNGKCKVQIDANLQQSPVEKQQIILKLSGVWENIHEYGIAFKLYCTNIIT
jgi:hypothetical protein